MQKQTILVVGGIFKNIANTKTVVTFEQITQDIQSGNINNVHLKLEQGISEQQYQLLKELIAHQQLKESITLSSYFDEAQRCSKVFTHKVNEFNTLISDPIRLDEQNYSAYLMVNECCAELSDHVTGQHLQGMLLMEAARQMTLAVTEKYFIDENSRSQVSFITNSSEVKHYAYAFPVNTKINYQIIKRRGLLKHNSEFTVTISFLQNKQKVADVLYKFSVFDKTFVKAKETSAIQNIVHELISTIGGRENGYAAA